MTKLMIMGSLVIYNVVNLKRSIAVLRLSQSKVCLAL